MFVIRQCSIAHLIAHGAAARLLTSLYGAGVGIYILAGKLGGGCQ